jgi:methionine-rich copper-binding protein CopC
MITHRRRILTIALISLSTAVVAAAMLVAPASAHNVLVASTPEANEIVTELPPRFSVTTNEPMLVVPGSQGFALQVRDDAGAYYGDGCVEVVDATMSAIGAAGTPGEYTMLWQAVSSDGHTIDGEIPFTWAPDADVDADAGSQSPPVCGQAASPTPAASAPTPSGEPTAEPAPASGIDLATVLWIAGALVALGIAAAVAIAIAGRRKP